MFNGRDPNGKGYSTRAHLAGVIGMIGPPPLDFIERGKRSSEFFSDDGPHISRSTRLTLFEDLGSNLYLGEWMADVQLATNALEDSEGFLEGKEKELFLDFMRGMLQWRPEDRKTARQLLQDPWLTDR